MSNALTKNNSKQEKSNKWEFAIKLEQKLGIWRFWIIALIVLLLGTLIFNTLHTLLENVHYHNLVQAIQKTSSTHLLLACLTTFISYLALTGYDFSSLNYVQVRVKKSTVFLTAFIAYALGNTAGLGVLTGGAVRMRIYTANGVDASKIASAIAFNTIAFGMGVATLGAMGIMWGAPEVEILIHVPSWLLRLMALLVLISIFIFIILCHLKRKILVFKRWSLRLPTTSLALRQLLICTLDLAASGATLWVLLPGGTIDITTFFAFYLIAVALAIISHIPGGIGVFETVILFACANQAPASEIAAALLIYRGIYFLAPLLLATVLLAILELHANKSAPVIQAIVKLSPWLLASLTLVTGVMLMVSGVIPHSRYSENLLGFYSPLYIIETSHLIGSMVGLILLFLARGLLNRLDAAWWTSLVFVSMEILFYLPYGIINSELIILLALALLLLISKNKFNRKSSLFSQTFEPGWLIAIFSIVMACGWILLFSYRNVAYSNDLWWQFALDGYAPRSMRTFMMIAILALGLGLWQLLRRSGGTVTPPSEKDLQQASKIIHNQPNAEACLALMGDKSFLFSSSGNSFIMFAKQNRSWIALSDPIGEKTEWQELIWEFIELANIHGGRVAFYKVRPQNLPLYLDAGLHAYKLGEEAYVPLDNFSLEGSHKANLRHGVNHAKRKDLIFEIIDTVKLSSILNELKNISDAWLHNLKTHEKSFSLGFFDAAYILSQPVAVVRQKQQIIAFASLMYTTECRNEASIDLMRHLPNVPTGTMDFLFVELMLYFKQQNFKNFGLGMAPMSGMTSHQLAPHWHRIAHALFQHGNRFYNFKGLRNFKNKFNPKWESRYLITKNGLGPLFVLTDTATLISGGLKGAIGK